MKPEGEPPTNLLDALIAAGPDACEEGGVMEVEKTNGERFTITFGPRVKNDPPTEFLISRDSP